MAANDTARSSLEQKPDDHSGQSVSADEEKATSPTEQQQDGTKGSDLEKQPSPPAPNAGPGPPPNGGTQAWLQVLGSWMLFFNTWGILNTFGVYQTYYESGELWSANSSNISWVGSIQALMVLMIGAFTGPIYDRGYLRSLLITGSFFIVFGHMMLSLTHTFWQALLAQGFVIGIGGGMLFVPAVAIMPTYFTTRIGLAIGLAASGSSMGGIIYPIMFERLLRIVGYAWSVRILGFTALATLIVPVVVMKMRVKPGKVRALIDTSAFTDWPFVTFVFGAMIGFIGLYTGFFYTSFYGQATGITNPTLSFYLVPILNAGSIFGRVLPNILSDKIGPLNVITPGAVMVGIVFLCYLPVHNVGGMVVVALCFGFFSGIFIALPPVLFFQLTQNKAVVGTRVGMGFAFLGAGVLAGGPGGGAILGTMGDDLDWTGTWIYAGVTVLAASVVFAILRIWKAGFKMVKI